MEEQEINRRKAEQREKVTERNNLIDELFNIYNKKAEMNEILEQIRQQELREEAEKYNLSCTFKNKVLKKHCLTE